jgi:hypothetical protein
MSGVSRKHPNSNINEQANKSIGAPDHLPGCLGYYSKNQAKCRACQYLEICKKTLPRAETIKLLREILDEIQRAKEVLKF